MIDCMFQTFKAKNIEEVKKLLQNIADKMLENQSLGFQVFKKESVIYDQCGYEVICWVQTFPPALQKTWINRIFGT